MENRGEGAQGIGARRLDLTHDIDQDGASLAQRSLNAGTLIVTAQFAADTALCSGDCQSTDMNRAKVRYGDVTIGADGQGHGLLRGPIDIDDELVARAQHIVLWGGDIHGRFEGQ